MSSVGIVETASPRTDQCASLSDARTDLPRAALFRALANQLLNLARRADRMMAVMVIIPGDAGTGSPADRADAGVAERIRRDLRSCDVAGHLDDGTLAVAAGGLATPGDVRRMVLRLAKCVQATPAGTDSAGAPRFVLGVALYPLDGDDVGTLFRAAVAAAATCGHEDSIAFATEPGPAQPADPLALEAAIDEALREHRLEVRYQPKIELRSGRIASFEALVQWHCPNLGTIPSEQLISAAEDTGQIGEVGAFVLETVARQLTHWQRSGLLAIPVSVNLSTREFLDHRLGLRVKEFLTAHALDPRLMTLEFSETSIMQHADVSPFLLRELAALGVGLCLDRFGTGFASLVCLHHFPIAEIKIDRMFVCGTPQVPGDLRIAAAAVALARELDLTSTAVGIERDRQRTFLTARGCVYG